MTSLLKIIDEARKNKTAIGHFNISDLVGLKAIYEAAYALNLPVIIGTSEGEREFLGLEQAVALVASLREKYNFPIFLNADHTHSLEKIKEAVESGYDAVLFDGSKLSLEENVSQTKEVVRYVKSKNKKILVEGEIGYIGSSSVILKELPKGAALGPEDLTKPEEAAEFVKKTGVDLLAPAVGNIHGMFANIPNPRLDIKRIAAIAKAVTTPLVLHGGSGTNDNDFVSAIRAGVSIIHINTEIRAAWRRGLEEG
ncbi:MAG: class II fructose-bisphosphate aldolase, partial [Candidatus Liptonbacteria bacterium]|nr:class II fructose-bisphosphate aldolase [Candidatus Liptonbacteria bacterium]